MILGIMFGGIGGFQFLLQGEIPYHTDYLAYPKGGTFILLIPLAILMLPVQLLSVLFWLYHDYTN